MADELKRNLQLLPRPDGSFSVKLEPGDAEALAPLLQPSRLLRIEDVVALTGVSKSRVYALIKVGEFPAPVKEGASSLWPSREVQRWIDAKAEGKRWPIE